MAEYPEQAGLTRTVIAAASIPANRIVTAAGALCGLSGIGLGISVLAAVTGEPLAVDTSGIRHVLTSTIPVTQGSEVACYANGTVGPIGSNGFKIGVAIEAAASATLVPIKITQ
jgi:hypothetical protein